MGLHRRRSPKSQHAQLTHFTLHVQPVRGTFRATVHVIDKVLVPPPVTSVAAALALRTDVNTLLAAVKAEGSYSAAINR